MTMTVLCFKVHDIQQFCVVMNDKQNDKYLCLNLRLNILLDWLAESESLSLRHLIDMNLTYTQMYTIVT